MDVSTIKRFFTRGVVCIKRFWVALVDTSVGESYTNIFRYLLPEIITAFVLYSLISCIDALFIARLCSTSLYAAQGLSSTILQFMTKVVEGLSVGTVVLAGYFNGRNDFKSVGKICTTALWVATIIGIILAGSLYGSVQFLYWLYGVSPKIAAYGIGFIKVRALGIVFSSIFFAGVGFVRSIKRTRIPMICLLLGGLVFVVLDYILIFGKFGAPCLMLVGSAYAGTIQYCVMMVGLLVYILAHPEFKKYEISLWSFSPILSYRLLMLSWPVVIDKASVVLAKMWVAFLLARLGKIALASFTVIKDVEQFSFVPAIACAQIVTILVSNDFGLQKWDSIKVNIKRILIIAAILVAILLCIFLSKPAFFIGLFDHKQVFTDFAYHALPIMSIFVIFDLLQLILAATLRGVGQMRLVMWVRLGTCTLFLVPYSLLMSYLLQAYPFARFIMIYSSFYIAGGIMGLIYWRYIKRFGQKQV
jgi:multidrug resistance protein, MATE family